MDLSLHVYHTCQGCPAAVSNGVANGNGLVLVPLIGWRTNREIISGLFQGAPCLKVPQSPLLVKHFQELFLIYIDISQNLFLIAMVMFKRCIKGAK